MSTKDYMLFLNVAGSVCSILALMLTISQNVTFALCVEALIAVVFFIATAGTLGALAYKLERVFIKENYWPFHLLFWLTFGLAIAFASLMVASAGFMFTAGFIHLGISAIHDFKAGNF